MTEEILPKIKAVPFSRFGELRGVLPLALKHMEGLSDDGQ